MLHPHTGEGTFQHSTASLKGVSSRKLRLRVMMRAGGITLPLFSRSSVITRRVADAGEVHRR